MNLKHLTQNVAIMKLVLSLLTWILHQNWNLEQLNWMLLSITMHARLIPENYYKDMEKDLDNEMKFVTEKKFICDVSKMRFICDAPIGHVKKSFMGCALKIQWQCIDGHCGDWHSSGISKKVYVNNILLDGQWLEFSLFW